MKKILSSIWKFINSKFFGYILVALILVFFAGQCRRNTDLQRENIIKEQNIAAADTTIIEYKTKEGIYQAEKAIWILTEKELKEQNTLLSNLVNKQSGNIISLNRANLSLKQDTILLHDSIRYLTAIIDNAIKIDDEIWILPWQLKYDWDENNYDYFKGKTLVKVDTANDYKVIHLDTQMDERDSQIDLTFGEKVVDGKYNVYISSKYPGLTSKSMEGVFINPNTNKDIKKLIEKRHWFTGFSLSVGMNVGYDFINNKPAITIGPSLGYTIYSW
jgi:hypothetical protein